MNHAQALATIQVQLALGAIESATHRCALDVLGETSTSANPEGLNCKSAEALEEWYRWYAVHWQDILDEETFGERFNIGRGKEYGCIEQMLSCTDYAWLFALLFRNDSDKFPIH